MGLFSKPEFKTVLMDFRFKEEEDLPCLQAYDGNYWCNADYAIKTSEYSMWEDGRYEKVKEAFENNQGRTKIEVELKIKKDKPVDFKIDLAKLAQTLGNKDIENLELIGWGFFDQPAEF